MEYGGGRGDLYLASACDRVVATEDAEFAPLGLRAERRYWRAALARAGVRVERSSIGAYKSAYRNFSADSMPPADSVVVQHELDVRQQLFTDVVCAGRKLAPARARALPRRPRVAAGGSRARRRPRFARLPRGRAARMLGIALRAWARSRAP